MVRTYSKYDLTQTFGLVSSSLSGIVSVSANGPRSTGSGYAVVGANEEVLTWDIKKGELIARWRDAVSTAQVTSICRSQPDPDLYAVGYEDGTIRLWDSSTHTIIVTFNGHKSAVNTLAFDPSGARLASGAKDTDIIVWDLLSEVGLFKLRAHKDQVVDLAWIYADPKPDQPASLSDATYLLSASKDATLKLWDIPAQHCLETHVAQTNGECWAMAVTPDRSGCITAGNDGELKIWSIDLQALITLQTNASYTAPHTFLKNRGVVFRRNKERSTSITFHPSADFFALHGPEKAVEIWRIKSEAEVQRALLRKKKRKREKALSSGDGSQMPDSHHLHAAITDYFVQHDIVRTGGKVSAIDWIQKSSSKAIHILVACTNNSLEVYQVSRDPGQKSTTEDDPSYSRMFFVDTPGHRADVRALALSSDDQVLASAANGALKIWNVRTGVCLRTLDCGYALCCTFLPGDKLVLVGTKSGDLQLFDISSSSLLDEFQGHDGAIWSLQLHPDGKSCVTGGADKTAKFWKFDIVQHEIPGTKRTASRVKLTHNRALKVNDDILSLCFSPDGRLLAVSTLDNTVKVFFVDSLKLFLNLYGHKLPVISISISSDSKLIATSSADKNIRLWGLDFGDCHRALFGHDDTVMAVKFIPEPATVEEGHFFFSASKDRSIKTWDGDKFQHIQKLAAHHGEVWALAVSRAGDFAVTAAHDKSIRVWNLSDEPIFLEEEREREMEELYEKTMNTSLDNEDGDDAEAGTASKQTTATLTAGERIVEALELGLEDLELVRGWELQHAKNPKIAPPQRDPLFLALGGISAERHVLNTVAKIPSAQLQDALLVLPFSTLSSLLTFIGIWVQKQWHINLVCRILFFMLKTHQKQIVTSKELKVPLEEIKRDLRATLGEMKSMFGFNLAALKCIEDRVREKGLSTLQDVEDDSVTKTKKRAFVDVA